MVSVSPFGRLMLIACVLALVIRRTKRMPNDIGQRRWERTAAGGGRAHRPATAGCGHANARVFRKDPGVSMADRWSLDLAGVLIAEMVEPDLPGRRMTGGDG